MAATADTAGACDAHVHVFDPSRFPYAFDRQYTPGTASCEELKVYLERAGLERVILVQPSVYGSDHRCMLDALEKLGQRARGIAVLEDNTTEAQIQDWDAAGMVGARINLAMGSSQDPSSAIQALQELHQRIPERWHIQLHGKLSLLLAMASRIESLERRVVIDHFGLPDMSQGVQHEDWRSFLALMRCSSVFVKLSAPYLVSQEAAPYQDLEPHIQSLASVDAKRLLWGSNWPHTQGLRRSSSADASQIESFRSESEQAWRNQCTAWLAHSSQNVLAGNAQRLYFSV
jgi:predicted TIM-barrel fold metal-dependent hydrolase